MSKPVLDYTDRRSGQGYYTSSLFGRAPMTARWGCRNQKRNLLRRDCQPAERRTKAINIFLTRQVAIQIGIPRFLNERVVYCARSTLLNAQRLALGLGCCRRKLRKKSWRRSLYWGRSWLGRAERRARYILRCGSLEESPREVFLRSQSRKIRV